MWRPILSPNEQHAVHTGVQFLHNTDHSQLNTWVNSSILYIARPLKAAEWGFVHSPGKAEIWDWHLSFQESSEDSGKHSTRVDRGLWSSLDCQNHLHHLHFSLFLSDNARAQEISDKSTLKRRKLDDNQHSLKGLLFLFPYLDIHPGKKKICSVHQ